MLSCLWAYRRRSTQAHRLAFVNDHEVALLPIIIPSTDVLIDSGIRFCISRWSPKIWNVVLIVFPPPSAALLGADHTTSNDLGQWATTYNIEYSGELVTHCQNEE